MWELENYSVIAPTGNAIPVHDCFRDSATDWLLLGDGGSNMGSGPEGIRTLGRPVKSRTLYLAKLQAPSYSHSNREKVFWQG